jgi:hypothetical protein
MKKRKAFDCVEMKRKIQEKMYREMQGMTTQEEIEYIRHRGAEFRKQTAAHVNTSRPSQRKKLQRLYTA